MLVLFFPESINVTVWTVAYAIPYHALRLYDQYGIGFGMLSLQAMESKHAGLKAELSLTNRSRKCDNNGKWWQIMRANCVRSFYLPEHQPSPSSSVPGNCLTVMILFIVTVVERRATVQQTHCTVCLDARHVVECAQHQNCCQKLLQYLNPLLAVYVTIACGIYTAGLEVHTNAPHTNRLQSAVTSVGNLKSLTVEQLKNHLRVKGLSTSGKKMFL